MKPKLRRLSAMPDYCQEYALAHELPYWDVHGDTVILLDGSLVQAIAITGIDNKTHDDQTINSLTVSLRSFLNALPDGIECSFVSSNEPHGADLISGHAAGMASDEAISKLTKDRQEVLNAQHESNLILNTRLKIYIYNRFNKVASKLGFFSKPNSFAETSLAEFEKRQKQLASQIESIRHSLSTLGITCTKMDQQALVDEIYRFLNPTRSREIPVPTISKEHRELEFLATEVAIAPELAIPSLREQLAFADIISEYDSLFYDGQYHRCITLKTLPEFTQASLISHFATLDFPYVLATHVRVPEQSEELARLHRSRRTAHSMSQPTHGDLSDMESESRLNSTEEVIAELINTDQKIFYFQLTVLLTCDDKEQLEAQTKAVLHRIRELNGAEGLAETTAAFKVWKTLLPLGTLGLVRPKRIKTDNLADFIPIYQHFSGATSARPICLLKGTQGNLVKYDPFDSLLPNYNALITGSSGSGKSFVNNIVMLQMLAHKPHTFIIDIGGSYRKICELVGGQYVDISPALPNQTPFNPFQLPAGQTEPSSNKIKFLLALLENILSDVDRPFLTKLNKSNLERAIVEVYARSRGVVTLSDFAAYLQQSTDPDFVRFSQMLYPWLRDRPYGKLLDTTTSISLENPFVVFDLKGLSAYPDLQSAMILIITDFLVTHIDQGKSQPTQIYIDECWELLKRPASLHLFEHFVRTLRKSRAGITFITQGLEEILNSPIASAILSNTATKIILQQRGDLDLVAKTLRLNHREAELVSSLSQIKGCYSEAFLVHNDVHTVLRIEPTALEYWVATSDPKDNLAIAEARLNAQESSLIQILQGLADKWPNGAPNK
jgi:conjugal transfer ATP-binding protein TraC